ncbi:MAG: hypothetical protein PHV08_05900 [Sulfurovaceae bacterium]|nr:hypothetical protein [Sulfurovaceae bacterium]
MNRANIDNFSETEKEVIYILNILIEHDIELNNPINIELLIDKAIFLKSLNSQDENSFLKHYVTVQYLETIPYVNGIVSEDFRRNIAINSFCHYQEKQYIKKHKKDERKFFNINLENECMRYDTMQKYIIYKIKQFQALGDIHNLSMSADAILLNFFNFLMDITIRYIICYEKNPLDKNFKPEECKKMFAGFDDDHKIEYKLDHKSQLILAKELMCFTENYQMKKRDVGANKNSDKNTNKKTFNEFKITLQNTLNYATINIKRIFQKDIYINHLDCKDIYKKHINMIDIGHQILNYSPRARTFRRKLIESNMNYMSKYNNEYIFPFLLDLITNRFVLLLNYTVYNKEFKNSKALANIYSSFDDKYIDHNDSEYYNLKQLEGLINCFPDKYQDDNLKKNIEQSISIFIIKHYSNILNTEYKFIGNVLRQLNYEVADFNKGEYKLPEYLINHTIVLDDDYFRYYSLHII